MNKRIRITDNYMSIVCDNLKIDKVANTLDVYNNNNYITSLDLKNVRLEYINPSSRTKFNQPVEN